MPIVGSFAGASARAYGANTGVLIGDFESIATITAGSAVANIEFTSIPATYTHLQIRGIARTSRTAISHDQIYMQLNSDTATNYSFHRLFGDGASASSVGNATQDTMSTFYATAASATASIFGVVIIDILDYKDTNKFKTVRMLGGSDANGSGYASLFSGNWRNTNAVTSIKLYPSTSTNFVQYSSFALYGVKA